MAFDLSTAKPVSQGFDLSSAKPVQQTDQPPASYFDQLRGSLAQQNDSMSGAERFLVGVGRGMTQIGRGVGLAGPEDQYTRMAADDLTNRYNSAFTGEIVGQAAPFMATLPVSGAGLTAGSATIIPQAASLAGRIGLGALNAGAQANILSRGQGNDAATQAVDTGIGAGIGAGIEVLMPVLGRVGGALFKKLGVNQTQPIVDAAGNLSDEFKGVLSATNTSLDDAISQAASKDEMASISELLRKGKTAQVAGEVNPNMGVLQSAERLGMDAELIPSHYSRNQSYIAMEQGLKSRPQSLLGTQESKALQSLAKKADETITRFGGYTDKSLLDSAISNDFRNTITSLSQQADTAYKAVDSAIPRAQPVSVDNARGYINGVIDELGGVGENGVAIGKSRLAPAEKDLLALVDSNPTYAYLDRLRKSVGKALFQSQGPYADNDTGVLKRVYGALSEDQMTAAKQAGVSDTLSAANKLVSTRKAIEEQSIQLFGRDVQDSMVRKLGTAASNLTKGDVATFERLIQAVPPDYRESAVSTMLNDVFTHGARNKDAMSSGFVNAYQQLNRNATAKDAIFKHLPDEARRRFDDIGIVATGIYNAKKFENTSGTARALLANIDSGHVGEKLFGTASKVAAAEGMSIAASLPPGVGSAVVLGSQYLKSKTPASEAADKLLSSGAFRDAVISAVENNMAKSSAIVNKSAPFSAWMKLQPVNVRQEIATAGFVPWLISNEGQQ